MWKVAFELLRRTVKACFYAVREDVWFTLANRRLTGMLPGMSKNKGGTAFIRPLQERNFSAGGFFIL